MEEIMQTLILMNTIRVDINDESPMSRRSHAIRDNRSKECANGNGLFWSYIECLVRVCMNKVGEHEERRSAGIRRM